MSEASKGLTKDEMKLLNDFSNTVLAREFTNEVTIQKLVLSYDVNIGFQVILEETPNNVVSEPPVEITE